MIANALLPLLLLLALAVLCGGFGWLVTRRLRWTDATERFTFAVPLGMGTGGMVILAGGLVGFLPVTLWKGSLILAVPLALFALYKGMQARKRSGNGQSGSSLFPLVAIVSLTLTAVCTFVAVLAPPAGLEWDSLSYHLANQKVWLQHGRIDYLPWDHHSNFPFVVQMLYLMMLGVGSIGAAKAVHWLCGVLLVLSVYTFCRRHVSPSDDGTPSPRGTASGLLAALIVASTPLVIWEATTAYVDLATALFTWLALYGLVNAAQATVARSPAGDGRPTPTTSVPWLIASAVLMGFALGTKYTVLGFWGLCLVGILGWNLVLTRRFAKETIPHAALWAGISLLIGLPWYIKNIAFTGNPVYPFAYGILGGRYWSAENAAQYAAEQANFGLGKSPLNLLMSPWDVTMEAALLPSHLQETGRPFIYTEYILYGLALSPVWVALGLAIPLLLGRRPLARTAIYCLLFTLGVFAFWFFVMQQTRYLIPALAPLAVVLAEVITGLWEERGRWLRYPVAAFTGIAVAWGLYLAAGLAFLGVPQIYGTGATTPAWSVVSGQVSREEYVTRTLGGVGAASFWINRNSAPQEGVAIFDEVRGFYLDRPYLWAQPDHAAGLIPWDTYENVDDWLRDFKQKGYTLLLLGPSPPKPDDKRWRSLMNEAIASDKVEPVFEERGVRVYRIR